MKTGRFSHSSSLSKMHHLIDEDKQVSVFIQNTVDDANRKEFTESHPTTETCVSETWFFRTVSIHKRLHTKKRHLLMVGKECCRIAHVWTKEGIVENTVMIESTFRLDFFEKTLQTVGDILVVTERNLRTDTTRLNLALEFLWTRCFRKVSIHKLLHWKHHQVLVGHWEYGHYMVFTERHPEIECTFRLGESARH